MSHIGFSQIGFSLEACFVPGGGGFPGGFTGDFFQPRGGFTGDFFQPRGGFTGDFFQPGGGS